MSGSFETVSIYLLVRFDFLQRNVIFDIDRLFIELSNSENYAFELKASKPKFFGE